MSVQVKTPDGATATFPDDTPPDTIKAAMQKKFGAPRSSPTTGAESQTKGGPSQTGGEGVTRSLFQTQKEALTGLEKTLEAKGQKPTGFFTPERAKTILEGMESTLGGVAVGAKTPILPELAKFIYREATGQPAAPKEPTPTLKESLHQIKQAFTERPLSTGAAVVTNGLIDMPVYALMGVIPGADEAALPASLARLAKAVKAAPTWAKSAAKGATVAAAQSGVQQLGETGRISLPETTHAAEIGAIAAGVPSIAGSSVRSLAKIQVPRDVMHKVAVDRAEQMGLKLNPGQVSGRRSAENIQKVVGGLTVRGALDEQAAQADNAKIINRTLNARAGIASDRADPNALALNKTGLGSTYGNLVAAERLEVSPDLQSAFQKLSKEAKTLGLGQRRDDIAGQRFVDTIHWLGSYPGKVRIPGSVYQKMRGDLDDARRAELAGARPDARAARWYADVKNSLDEAFDQSLQAQGKTQELGQIQTLRKQLEANYRLLDLVTVKGGIVGDSYDATKLLKVLRDSYPGWEQSTDYNRIARMPFWGVAETADELKIRPPGAVEEGKVGETFASEHGIMNSLRKLSWPAGGALLSAYMATKIGAPAAVGGVALQAFPYLWKNAARLETLPSPAYPFGGAGQEYTSLMEAERGQTDNRQ